MGTWMQLHVYWEATNASNKWKLIIYDAIVRRKLLYGLETVQLTQGILKKLDVFQLKGLRKILGMTTTYINRANSNQKVFQEASHAAFPKEGDNRRIKPFGEAYPENEKRPY